MWLYAAIDAVVGEPLRSKHRPDIPVLVIPENPTCRITMIDRTVAILWPELSGKARATKREMVEIVLATALCPTNRR